MLMHEWVKYRDRQVERTRGEPTKDEPQPWAEGAEAAANQDAQAHQVIQEISERADEAQTQRLQALLAQQQRLPLDVEVSPSEQVRGGGARAKENREELVERLLDPTLTLSETATILGVCPTTVRRYTKRGVLNCFRTPGNQRRFKLSDILDFMEQQREGG